MMSLHALKQRMKRQIMVYSLFLPYEVQHILMYIQHEYVSKLSKNIYNYDISYESVFETRYKGVKSSSNYES